MVESAMYHVRLIEKFDYDQIVVSIKTSDVANMVRSYRLMADRAPYPLHLGVTAVSYTHLSVSTATGSVCST